MSVEQRIVIIGAGISGLSAAISLEAAGREVLLLCAGTRVGGRVRTDAVETRRGRYLLDRGFQVYLTAYEQAGSLLDLGALRLGAFEPGALVRIGDAFHRVADPFRRPAQALVMFGSPVASIADKARLAMMDHRIRRASVESIWDRPESASIDMLAREGFGSTAIDRFFKPFFGGVFFDTALRTSSRMLEFTYRHFTLGDAALPAAGMGAIPEQLASRVRGEIRLDTPAARVDPDARSVLLASGQTIRAETIVLAADANAQAQLLGRKPWVDWNQTATIYFDADPDTLGQVAESPLLALDGEGTGPVNHVCVPSAAAPSYAPSGRALVACNIAGTEHLQRLASDDDLDAAVREQMASWFGGGVSGWERLGLYRIRHALPRRTTGLDPRRADYTLAPDVYTTGDHLTHGSIEGAVVAGRGVAEDIRRRG
jgi:phytoene dehydrogenase-like protein